MPTAEDVQGSGGLHPCADHAIKMESMFKDIERLGRDQERAEASQKSMADQLQALNVKVTQGFEDTRTQIGQINVRLESVATKEALITVAKEVASITTAYKTTKDIATILKYIVTSAGSVIGTLLVSGRLTFH